jgi:hypothetical protein
MEVHAGVPVYLGEQTWDIEQPKTVPEVADYIDKELSKEFNKIVGEAITAQLKDKVQCIADRYLKVANSHLEALGMTQLLQVNVSWTHDRCSVSWSAVNEYKFEQQRLALGI